MTSSPAPETSIVIRAFNEERWLPEVFEALARQRYRNFEVLVVDSGSIDRTREIAAANGARIVRLRSEDFTFGHSLNVGIRESKGSFIAIISAHAIPADENWLERLVAPLRRDEVAMVYGGQRGHQISKFSEARDFERIFTTEPHIVCDP
jgi:glycosyltransferase involved in cell wall biosynthesis